MTDHEKLLVGLLSATDTAHDPGRDRYLELLAALASIRSAPSLAQNAAWN
jgi:hypothetical protein